MPIFNGIGIIFVFKSFKGLEIAGVEINETIDRTICTQMSQTF